MILKAVMGHQTSHLRNFGNHPVSNTWSLVYETTKNFILLHFVRRDG